MKAEALDMFRSRPGRPSASLYFSSSDKYQVLQERDSDLGAWQISLAARIAGAPPTHGELVNVFTDAVERIPALGHRVVGKGRRARFEPVTGLDVARHIEEIEVPAGSVPARCTLEAQTRPFPAGRPPWTVQVIRGYSPDEYLLVYRAAHVLQDGVAIARTLEALFSGARLPPPVARPRSPAPSSEALRRSARFLPHFFGRTARWLPSHTAAGRGRVLHTVTLDRARFDTITHRTGSTTAQIALAVLAGALRAWTPEHWCGTSSRRQRRGLRCYMPISLRPPGDRSALGNAVGVVPFTLPCADPSPESRLEKITHGTGFTALHQFRQVFGCLMRIPHFYRSSLFMPPRLGVTIVPMGPYESGLDILELIPVPPSQNRCPVVCSFTLERTRVTASFNCAAAIPGTDRLPALLTAALAELHGQDAPSGTAQDQHRVVAAEAE
ncbi:hypothetical protein CTZ27_22890 [Streptomyces griseocarneus]|nr:hypothetical protein CTZ27_22890 [Streptomyces griseocarneus]